VGFSLFGVPVRIAGRANKALAGPGLDHVFAVSDRATESQKWRSGILSAVTQKAPAPNQCDAHVVALGDIY
jgi:hypothetical protein